MPKLSDPTPIKRYVKADPDMLDAAMLAKQNPMQWVELDGTHSPSVVTQINAGEHPAFPSRDWKAQSRTDFEATEEEGKRRVRVWVKCLGHE